MTLHMSQEMIAAIRRSGEAAYPGECCGILAGGIRDDAKHVAKLVPVANGRTDDPHRYLIAADDVRRAERQLAGEGLEIVGYYHSHPDHPAEPSAFDTAHAWPWYSYVIVRVDGGRGQELASWVLDEGPPVMRSETLEVFSEV